MSKTLKVRVRDRWYTVEVDDQGNRPVRVLVDGEPVEVDIERLPTQASPLPLNEPKAMQTSEPKTPINPTMPAVVKVFRSPMPGVVLSVAVEEGDQVVTGDAVCVLEAMKMQQTLRADWTGIVRAVCVQPGQQVLDGDPIIELE